MRGGKEKSFPPPFESGWSDKRMRESRGSCGYLGALKSLLRQSVSTGATSVTIRIDLEYPYLQIADNGAGIPRSEIGEIGKATFLDLITAAEEVLIETMTGSMEKSVVMEFRNKVLLVPKNTAEPVVEDETFDWLRPSTSKPKKSSAKAISCTGDSSCHKRDSTGTTFTLTNIQLSLMDRVEKLPKKIADLVKQFAIVHYQMSVTLKDIKGDKLLFGTKKAKSITEKVASIYKLDNMEFDSISRSSNNMTIEVFWGTKLHNTSAIQLVFVNGEPCTNVRLLKAVKKEWKCGGKKQPVYVLCITIRSSLDGNIDNISHDSVIKDCIRECVIKWKSCLGNGSFLDNESIDRGSVYVRPFIMREEFKKRLEIRKRDKAGIGLQFMEDPPIIASPPCVTGEGLVRKAPEGNGPKSPRATPKNPSVSLARSARQYLQSEKSATVLLPSTLRASSRTDSFLRPLSSQSNFVNHLEEQGSARRKEVSYLQGAAELINELKEKQKRDKRRIEQLMNENLELKASQQRPTKDDCEPSRKRSNTSVGRSDQVEGQTMDIGHSNADFQKQNQNPIIIYNSQVTIYTKDTK